MGSFFSAILIFLSFLYLSLTPATSSESQKIKSARLLDLILRDYTLKSFSKHIRTGAVQNVQLPANLSGIKVDTARFRCGSLSRYGAQVKEFHLGIGVTLLPCIERVMIVRQNLGSNWSSIYYSNYDISGYQLVTPVLGLLAYNAISNINFSNAFQLEIQPSNGKPITVDFRNVTTTTKFTNITGIRPLCANFQDNGKVTVTKEISPYVCSAKRHGHFGLVTELPPVEEVNKNRRISRWKLALGTSVGVTLGAFLLGLLMVAMLVKVKKKARMEELERRAYEEEALQVSMVGHIRAPTAPVTRTTPIIEHQYIPYPS